jgi:hypothetical protein
MPRGKDVAKVPAKLVSVLRGCELWKAKDVSPVLGRRTNDRLSAS